MANKTVKGLMWRSLEGIGVQGMQFIIQMVLARILMPEDFGILAILNIFINLANTFVQNGLSSAILQKKKAEYIDFCSVFHVEIVMSLLMYVIVFAAAPFIAVYYENSDLTLYMRVFALTIIISALGSTQTTVLRNNMDFKPSFIANFAGIIIQGATGISAALLGFGVWSLIISQILYRITTTFLLFWFARWTPRFQFSWTRLTEMFSYSWKLLAAWLIGTLYNDVISLVVGKVYSAEQLGYYSKGNSIPNVINRVVTQVTTAVMFPAISKVQDQKDIVKYQTRKMISLSSVLIFPVMAVVAGCARPLVQILLTEKWLPAVPVIQLFCIPMAINVISNANMQSFNAIGRSDVFLKFEIIKRSLTIIVVIFTSRIDFILMLSCIAAMGFVSLIINAFYNVKLLKYSVKEQVIDIAPYMVISVIIFMGLFFIEKLNVSAIMILGIQLLVATVIYFGLVFFSNIQAFDDFRDILRPILHKVMNRS